MPNTSFRHFSFFHFSLCSCFVGYWSEVSRSSHQTTGLSRITNYKIGKTKKTQQKDQDSVLFGSVRFSSVQMAIKWKKDQCSDGSLFSLAHIPILTICLYFQPFSKTWTWFTQILTQTTPLNLSKTSNAFGINEEWTDNDKNVFMCALYSNSVSFFHSSFRFVSFSFSSLCPRCYIRSSQFFCVLVSFFLFFFLAIHYFSV